jgi:type IV secretory pathway VirD2 relaxase
LSHRVLLRAAIERRLSEVQASRDETPAARLPTTLRTAQGGARTSLLARLSVSRRFSLGRRAGGLGGKGGGRLTLHVSQRVIVKVLVSRHRANRAGRSALLGHVAYLARAGAGLEGERGPFFDASHDRLSARALARTWEADRHHFRFIVSPEHGDRLSDLPGYIREMMAKVAADLSEPDLCWMAVCHFDTDQPHAHVLVRGRKRDGRDLVMPRAYIGHGVRARAQEIAQAELGDLTRSQAEARVWRETEANRFTGFDRRLIEAAEADGTVADGNGGSGAWSALTRGRLRHLERLGLAVRVGERYRLSTGLEEKLRSAQVRTDVIRTLNQRRLEGAREVRLLAAEQVVGEVVKAGFHDELCASAYVVIRDAAQVEHYAALGPETPLPRAGEHMSLQLAKSGRAVLTELAPGATLAGRDGQDLGL